MLSNRVTRKKKKSSGSAASSKADSEPAVDGRKSICHKVQNDCI